MKQVYEYHYVFINAKIDALFKIYGLIKPWKNCKLCVTPSNNLEKSLLLSVVVPRVNSLFQPQTNVLIFGRNSC